MSTVTGKTAAAMDAIANACIVDGTVNGSGHLILTKQDTTTIDTGNVIGPTGSTGATGAAGADGAAHSIDYIVSAHATGADWSNNSHKITSLANGSSAQDAAAYGQIVKKAGDTMTGKLAPAVVALTFGSSIAIDASLGNQFTVTLTSSAGTFAAPSNPTDGQPMVINVKQDGSGSRTVAYNSVFQFSTSLPSPTLSTAANAKDRLGFIYDASASKWDFVAFVSGYTA